MRDKDALNSALDKMREGLTIIERVSAEPRDSIEVDCRAAGERFLDAAAVRRGALPRLSGDPAWELLVTLYLAQDDQREVGTAAAIHAIGVAPTTGLRLIDRLELEGLVSRKASPEDKRKKLIQLTSAGTASVEGVLRQMG